MTMLFLTSLLASMLLTAYTCSDSDLTEPSCIDCNEDKPNLSLVECETIHKSQSMVKLFTGLKTLNLRQNLIENLTNSNFEGLESLTVLDLSENLLTSLPDDFLRYMPLLNELSISENPLAELSGNALRGSNLVELYIEDNKVPLTLMSRALADMLVLTNITLTNCGITILPSDLLDGSNAVENIILSNNHINHIPADLFANKISLMSLWLDSNELHELSSAVFSDLSSLLSLYLDYNQLSEIQAGTFSALNDLLILAIEYNRLRVVSPESFPPSLMNLYLSGNELTTLETQLLPQLVELYLDNNSLSSVPQSWPETFPCMEELSLLENAFTRLTESDMAVLAHFSMKTVYFGNNKIVSILVDKNATNSSNLSLGDAPLRCDCSMYEFAKHLHNNLSSVENAYCAEPASLKGSKLDEVPLKDFVCPYESCPDICECVVRPATNTLEVLCKEPLTAEEKTQLQYLGQKNNVTEKTTFNYSHSRRVRQCT